MAAFPDFNVFHGPVFFAVFMIFMVFEVQTFLESSIILREMYLTKQVLFIVKSNKRMQFIR